MILKENSFEKEFIPELQLVEDLLSSVYLNPYHPFHQYLNAIR